ncbi:hypothetical protein [Gordonia aichiensis]|uniref:Uncharacterized protein n=1 Tax=Gordonia aichiensis NBRC 108223 TaxID=1220583 RepID=L7KS30_9ACTN|nr:hypothetical protein [Gordonia aichiensis]GAC50767.1 hypothetical protein GOACH_30_00130 [Gordonia aichiensis NBRC 108223]
MAQLTYEQFGRRFFEVAVTEERVGSAFSSLTGESFDVGPIPSGPGGIARVTAHVEIGEPDITRTVGELITFTVEIMLNVGLVVDLRVDRIRYDVDGLITLPLTVRAAEPLELRIDVTPPRPRDVIVDVAAHNLRGEFIRAVGQVDSEIKRFIAQHVADEIEKPEVRAARIIDVGAELGRAFENM